MRGDEHLHIVFQMNFLDSYEPGSPEDEEWARQEFSRECEGILSFAKELETSRSLPKVLADRTLPRRQAYERAEREALDEFLEIVEENGMTDVVDTLVAAETITERIKSLIEEHDRAEKAPYN